MKVERIQTQPTWRSINEILLKWKQQLRGMKPGPRALTRIQSIYDHLTDFEENDEVTRPWTRRHSPREKASLEFLAIDPSSISSLIALLQSANLLL